METDRIVFREENYRIVGACSKVHTEKGKGINYEKTTGKQLGLLVNFGDYPKIEYERFVNPSLSRISRVS